MMAMTLPQHYYPKDIFNIDEAGLIWEAQVGKTFTFKGDKGNGKKKPNSTSLFFLVPT